MLLNIKLFKDNQIMIDQKNLPYEKENNRIHFKLENFNHIIDCSHKIFQRESDEFCFILDFERNKCTYRLKELNGDFDIIIDDFFWEEKENSLEIHYAIETDDEKTKIIINFNK